MYLRFSFLAVVVTATCLPAAIGCAGGEVDLWARPVLAVLALVPATGAAMLSSFVS